ncbi:hypothetical protein [Pedobacter mendelii]|uniref:Auto-transporter adhesin head GIN domain-containing protein n=1 Tax=Pedobacter mendelii TaxID=1908240 RepID=A0ABQ2BF37_9SPHI|nr:hypothetical protein [Pedobacter mendelii]GGI22357.1 hypothetical protein GCM10008119_02240 [Pedobacter mendelii]
MKSIICAILLSVITLSFGCKNNYTNLSINIKDSETEFTYAANYPESKTDKLEVYIAHQLNTEFKLDQNINTSINLFNGEKISLKATKGFLKINFDKKNTSITGYIKMKKLADGISAVLSEK